MSRQEYSNIIKQAKENNINVKIQKINNDIQRGVGYEFIVNNLECYCHFDELQFRIAKSVDHSLNRHVFLAEWTLCNRVCLVVYHIIIVK